MADPRSGSETIYYPRENRDGDLDSTALALEPTNSTCTINTFIDDPNKEQMVVKIGILGDQDVGKSSFMRRYVCEEFTQHSSYGYYNNSPGSVLFLEKQISMKQVNLFLELWCSTTYSIYESALQLVCKDANVIIFMFSLTDKRSLNSIKLYYDQALSQNKQFIPILVGTKYDIMQEDISSDNPKSHQYLNDYHKITRIARKYAMKMKASLVYISSKTNININHIIKVCVAKVFNIRSKLKEHHWNTLKALREHHVSRILKCWSNQKKMTCLIYGYLKRENIANLPIIFDKQRIMSTLIEYIQYDLQPLSSHHHEGKKKKSCKKHKIHRKKSSKVKHTSHKKSCKKKKKSKRHRKHIHKTKPPQPPIHIIGHIEPGSSTHINSARQYSAEGHMLVEGAIKL